MAGLSRGLSACVCVLWGRGRVEKQTVEHIGFLQPLLLSWAQLSPVPRPDFSPVSSPL